MYRQWTGKKVPSFLKQSGVEEILNLFSGEEMFWILAKKVEMGELLCGLSEAKTLLWPAFNYFCPNLHPEESICDRSHLKGFERTRRHPDPVLPNGLKNGFEILLRIDEGIGGSQLREEVSI